MAPIQTKQDYCIMRKMTEELCAKTGVNEIIKRIREKLGDSPAICTVFKWRKEFRERKREHEEEGEKEMLDEGQKSTKIPKTVWPGKGNNKYCVECDRDFSNRLQYELHMLKFHGILLGGSKSVLIINYLDQLTPTQAQNLIFRCDACIDDDGTYEFDTIDEFQQHKLKEHFQIMQMPKWSFIGKLKVDKMPFKNEKSSMPAASSMTPPPAANPKYSKMMNIRRDKSLPASSILRRSKRVQKPNSTLNYLSLAANESGDEDKERKKPKAKEFPRKGHRTVNFREESKEIDPTNEGLMKLGGNNEKPVHAKRQQEENGDEKVNGIGGLLPEEEAEDFVIGNPTELVLEQIQKQQKEQENPPVNDEPEFTPTKRQRSPDALDLDAANSLLKLTYGSSPVSSESIFSEHNYSSSPIPNDDDDQIMADTAKTSGNSISNSPFNSMKLPSFNLPLPQPSNFSDLSIAELAEREKAELKATEARIQALQNIQWLFDQAMLQFQQYLAAMPSSTNTTIRGNGTINGIQEFAISNSVPSSMNSVPSSMNSVPSSMNSVPSSMDLVPSSSSMDLLPSSSSSSSIMPSAIQNGISASSSMETMNNNKSK